MDGLFVRKHAEAVGRYADVEVLYIRSDENINDFEIVENDYNGVHEVTVYFPKQCHSSLRPLVVAVNYWRAFAKGMKRVKLPDISQVNVLGRDGLCAWWLKKRYGIPYVAIEHWTRYLPENFNYCGRLTRWVTELVARNAEVVMPVSRPLAEQMQRLGIRCSRYEVINNVVDDFFYAQPTERRVADKKRFVSVTCFSDRAKNLTGLLRAVKELSKLRTDFELVMVGTGADYQRVVEYAASLEFADGMVRFVGEQTPTEVSQLMRESDFVVMFSNFENAPCVISEALAEGKPVVSTLVGGIADMVPSFAGELIAPRDEAALTSAIDRMLDHHADYDAAQIRSFAQQYSYAQVGQRLLDTYNNILNKPRS